MTIRVNISERYGVSLCLIQCNILVYGDLDFPSSSHSVTITQTWHSKNSSKLITEHGLMDSISLNLFSCFNEFVDSPSRSYFLDDKTTFSYILHCMAVNVSSANPQYYGIDQIHYPG